MAQALCLGWEILAFEFVVLSFAVYFLRRGNLQVVSWILISVIYAILLASLFISGFTLATVIELALIVALYRFTASSMAGDFSIYKYCCDGFYRTKYWATILI